MTTSNHNPSVAESRAALASVHQAQAEFSTLRE